MTEAKAQTPTTSACKNFFSLLGCDSKQDCKLSHKLADFLFESLAHLAEEKGQRGDIIKGIHYVYSVPEKTPSPAWCYIATSPYVKYGNKDSESVLCSTFVSSYQQYRDALVELQNKLIGQWAIGSIGVKFQQSYDSNKQKHSTHTTTIFLSSDTHDSTPGHYEPRFTAKTYKGRSNDYQAQREFYAGDYHRHAELCDINSTECTCGLDYYMGNGNFAHNEITLTYVPTQVEDDIDHIKRLKAMKREMQFKKKEVERELNGVDYELNRLLEEYPDMS